MVPRPVQQPRIPVWCAGRWPNKAPFRRAARWDGVMPTHTGYGLGQTMPPDDLRAVIRYTLEHRTTGGPFDVALEGRTDGAAPDRGGRHVARYAEAGLTWWIEALGWWRGTPQDALARIRQGPPVLPGLGTQVLRGRRRQAMLIGEPDGLGAVAGACLGEDPVDVSLDRGVAQEETLGNLGVAQARGEEGEHLGLAGGEPRRRWPTVAGLIRGRTMSRPGPVTVATRRA